MELLIKNFNELSTMELYKIIKERVDVFVVEQKCLYPEVDLKDIRSYHLILWDEDNIIGYLRILPPGISYKEASIGRVLINIKYRGFGYGKVIMKNAINYIERELEQKTIKISAQEYLVDFYQEFGFKVVSNVYDEDGIPHVEMLYN